MVVVGVVSAATAAGVTYAIVHRDGTASVARRKPAPVVLTGTLRDTAGRPVANAMIQLGAFDELGHVKRGERIPMVPLATGHTDAAGRFTIRQSKSVPILRKLAAENGGWVNFDVFIGAGGRFMPWGLPRKIGSHGWIADEDTPAGLKHEQITFKDLAKG
jgi:hypothetical protein